MVSPKATRGMLWTNHELLGYFGKLTLTKVPQTIETQRLALRVFHEKDWQPLCDLFRDEQCVRYTVLMRKQTENTSFVEYRQITPVFLKRSSAQKRLSVPMAMLHRKASNHCAGARELPRHVG